MVTIVPFRAEHLSRIKVQAAQAAEVELIGPEQARAMEMSSEAFSLLANGEVKMCAGLTVSPEGRGNSWAVFGADAGPYLLRAARFAKKWFEASGLRRIEAIMLGGFTAGERWIKLLGFELETPNGMKAFGPNGETYYLYARVKWPPLEQ